MDNQELLHIFEKTPIPMCVVDARSTDFTLVTVNNAYMNKAERETHTLVGKSFFEAFPANPDAIKPRGTSKLEKSFQKVIATKQKDELYGLRYDIKDKNDRFVKHFWQVINTPVFDKQGSVKHIINTVIDVTNDFLNDWKNKIMLNNTVESFLIVDTELKIINYNTVLEQNFTELFGLEVMAGASVLDFVKPARKKMVKANYCKALKGETVTDLLKFKSINGTDRYFHAIYKPALNASEQTFGVFLSMREVTEKHKAEEQLKAEETRFKTLVEAGNDIIILFDKAFSPKYISPSMQTVLGYTIADAYELDIIELVHPKDRPHVEKELQISLENPGEIIPVTPARMMHKNGSWRWLDGTLTNMLHNPDIRGIVDNFKDITDKVEAELKLKEAKEKSESLIQSVEGIIWEAEADTFQHTFVSPQVKYILGHTEEQWLEVKDFWEHHIHPDDKENVLAQVKSKISENSNHELEYRFRKANGDYIWVRDVVVVIPRKDGPDILRGIIIDINHQKKLSNLLEEAYRIAKIGNWEYNFEEDKLFWSHFVYELHEVPADYEPQIEDVLNFYFGKNDKVKAAVKLKAACKNGATIDEELAITTARGNKKWIRTVGTPEMVNGKCVRIFGSSQDITDRVIAQKELEEAEEKLRNVVEHSTNMFYTHTIDGFITYVSPQSTHFLGCEPEEAKRGWFDFLTDHPKNDEGIEITKQTINSQKIQEPYELQLKTADNRVIWVEVNEAPLLENGKTVAIVGSLTDITERKKYETQLKESIERYNYVTKATRDAIYDWDITANKVIWGEGLKNLFGYDPQSYGKTENAWDTHIHPEDFEEFREGLNKTLKNESKRRWIHEYRFKKADGTFTYVSENGYIIRNSSGKALRMIGTIQDISESVAAKEEIQASLTEKETLLSEIHHRVKNNLAVVSGMMQLQAFEEDNVELQAKLFDSVSRIKTMATVHELLYQSRSFSKLNFSETAQKLVKNISQTLQTEPNIQIKSKCDNIKLNINQAIPTSLIINEVLTNTYKHAFNGRSDGCITFNLRKKGKLISIQIKDDGVGFPPDFDPKSSSSLGFHLIKVLSEQIHASYSYESSETGTSFDLSFTKVLSK